jgi:peroxiredoxin Q/BCP
MQAYRDQYASLFRGGEGVTLIAVSNDSAQDLHEWARDEDFPFLFGSDPDGAVYSAFGGEPWFTGISGSRAVIVIDPEGVVSYVTPAFNQVDPVAYEELGRAIEAVTPEGGS